jgi:hypothetical protein
VLSPVVVAALRSAPPADPERPRTGDADLGDLRMYDEVHGEGDGTPLLLLHGGLFDIDDVVGDATRTSRASRAHAHDGGDGDAVRLPA